MTINDLLQLDDQKAKRGVRSIQIDLYCYLYEWPAMRFIDRLLISPSDGYIYQSIYFRHLSGLPYEWLAEANQIQEYNRC